MYSVGFHAEPMKVLGGHDKNQPFPILDRDLLDPPKELLLRTFPWISKCRTVISDNLLSGRFKTEVTGENFLELCSILMIVYYQDAAVRLYEVRFIFITSTYQFFLGSQSEGTSRFQD